MNLHELVLYEDLNRDKVIDSYVALLNASYSGERHNAYFKLVKELLSVGMSFEVYLYTCLIKSDNSLLEQLSHADYKATSLDRACLANDITIIRKLITSEAESKIVEVDDAHQMLRHLMSDEALSPSHSAYKNFFQLHEAKTLDEQCDLFIELLHRYGCGRFASQTVFYLDRDDSFVPVEDFSPLQWAHIYDYETQKEQLLNNTKALVEGRPFHHCLLVGASGTGKSSSVKAVVDYFSDQQLRLIQLYKGQLRSLPKLLKTLSKSMFKFVLFIDDLSFEVNEDDYKLLKSYIEGGIVNEASNIAFYVTSNRQHLIKEIRSDREGDIHLQDFIQEMTSLSRRFGLRLTFDKLQQKDYFEMIARMLEDEGITYERSKMEIEARQWSLRHGGMSGRIANQFVKQLQMNPTA